MWFDSTALRLMFCRCIPSDYESVERLAGLHGGSNPLNGSKIIRKTAMMVSYHPHSGANGCCFSWLSGGIGRRIVLKRRRLRASGFDPQEGYQEKLFVNPNKSFEKDLTRFSSSVIMCSHKKFALVPELAYGLDLKSGVCGFDSHQGHQKFFENFLSSPHPGRGVVPIALIKQGASR